MGNLRSGTAGILLACGLATSAYAQVQKLGPTPGWSAYPLFAESMAMDAQSGYLVVSSYWQQPPGAGSGYVELFRRGTNGWVRETGLTRTSSDTFSFGYKVAAGDGWIAAYSDVVGTISVVDMFHREGNAWVFRQRLTPSIPGAPYTAIRYMQVNQDHLLVAMDDGGFETAPVYRIAAFHYDGTTWQAAGTLNVPIQVNSIAARMALLGDEAAVTLTTSSPLTNRVAGFTWQGSQWTYRSMIDAPVAGDISLRTSVAFCHGGLYISSSPFSGPTPATGTVQFYTGSAAAWQPAGPPLTGPTKLGSSLACSGRTLAVGAANSNQVFRRDRRNGILVPLTVSDAAAAGLDGDVAVLGRDVVIADPKQNKQPNGPATTGAAYAFTDDVLFVDDFE